MKKAFLFSLLMILTVMLILSCSEDKKTNPDTEPPTVVITYPPNNSSFTSGTAINIVAEADDNEDINNVKFYIDGVNLYEDTSEPYMYNWDTTDLSGSHTIYAKATDSSENTSTSDIVTVSLTDSGEAPNPPSNPNPQSGATNVSTNTTLSWTCTDPNGDQLTYDVYFGTNANPPLVSTNLNVSSFEPGTLLEETIYYWYIEATDTDENTTNGPLWSFTTLTNGGSGQPPNSPSNPNPADNETDVSIDTNLSWTCTDPDGDPLTYDVYFGTSSSPPIVNSGQSEITYNPGTLDFEETYYWQIVAHDDHSNSTTGDVWEFTTTIGGPGTVTDIDGNVYQIIIIGNQEWIMENLKVTHYRNGDAIPHLTDNGDWASTNSGAYCVYDNDPSNAETYGNLYNGYTMDDSRGLAPEGWHIPTDEEIMVLEMYLGMSQSQADSTGWRGTNEGSKLAGRADLWASGALENDPEFGTSGFSFLPGGCRHYSYGSYGGMSNTGFLWSSTEINSSNTWDRALHYQIATVGRYPVSKHYGWSVRCVKD